jgi:HEAT repeat protein
MLTLGLLVSLALLCAAPPATTEARQQKKKEPAYDGKTVSEWLARIEDKDPRVREKAAFSLRQLGPEATAAVPALAGRLTGDADVAVRQEAAFALQRIGPAARPAIPALVRALDDRDGHVRSWALLALADFRADARAAAPALDRVLKKDPEVGLRVQAAQCLWRMGVKKLEALAVLIEAVRREEGLEAAANVLGELGPDARPAVPALLAALERPYPVSPGRCGERVMRRLESDQVVEAALKKIDPKAKRAGKPR